MTYADCQVISLDSPTNDVWTVGTGQLRDWHTGLLVGTSPAITRLPSGGHELALATNYTSDRTNADLWTLGDAGDRDWRTGVGQTTPAITSESANGYEVAVYPGYVNQTWILGSDFIKVYNVGHEAGNTMGSPAITS